MKLIDASACPCNACGAKQYCDSNCLSYWKWFNKPVDAVEVVRCKDCKYAFFSKSNSETIICGNTKMCGTTDANFFCANGVKRDGGTDNDKGASEE